VWVAVEASSEEGAHVAALSDVVDTAR
jgi:hypothetical protein